jgi:hypothetical protein
MNHGGRHAFSERRLRVSHAGVVEGRAYPRS